MYLVSFYQLKRNSQISLIVTALSFSILGGIDICGNTSCFQRFRFAVVLNGIFSKIFCIGTQKLKEWQKQHIPTVFIHTIHISLCVYISINFCGLRLPLYRQSLSTDFYVYIVWVKTKPCIFRSIIFKIFVKISLHDLSVCSCYGNKQKSNYGNTAR